MSLVALIKWVIDYDHYQVFVTWVFGIHLMHVSTWWCCRTGRPPTGAGSSRSRRQQCELRCRCVVAKPVNGTTAWRNGLVSSYLCWFGNRFEQFRQKLSFPKVPFSTQNKLYSHLLSLPNTHTCRRATFWNPVYTIQPVVKPVVQPVWQPAVYTI